MVARTLFWTHVTQYGFDNGEFNWQPGEIAISRRQPLSTDEITDVP
jgi:hypothetical protein